MPTSSLYSLGNPSDCLRIALHVGGFQARGQDQLWFVQQELEHRFRPAPA